MTRLTNLRKCVAALAIAVAIVSTACSADGNSQQQFNSAVDELTQRAIADALDEAPRAQQEALSDGVVTFAEYEAAVLGTLSCLSDAGVKVFDVGRSPDGKSITYTYGGVPDDRVDTLEAIYNDCRDSHSSFVEEVYSIQNAVPAQEHQDRLAKAAACIAQIGIAVPPEPSLAELTALISENPSGVADCLTTAGL